MKIESIQTGFESIQKSQDEDWIDSDRIWIYSTRVRKEFESIQIYLNRFNQSQRGLWINSN